MRIMAKVTAAVACATLVVGGTANAQAFNFGTRGQFVSAAASCNTGALFTVVCSTGVPGGLSLTYTGNSPVAGDYASPTTVQLGQFDPAGAGEATVPAGTVLFRLFIDQGVPSPAATDYFEGYITGYFRQNQAGTPGDPCLGAGANCSQLVWTPTTTSKTINGVNYALQLNQGNVFKIAAVVPSTVKADVLVTATPEPATITLMAGGLLALGAAVRRRRAL